MIINHNLSAINSHRTLKFQHWDVDRNMEKLSSGMRINRAGDDASGLAVSENCARFARESQTADLPLASDRRCGDFQSRSVLIGAVRTGVRVASACSFTTWTLLTPQRRPAAASG